MPITPKTGSLFHADSHAARLYPCRRLVFEHLKSTAIVSTLELAHHLATRLIEAFEEVLNPQHIS